MRKFLAIGLVLLAASVSAQTTVNFYLTNMVSTGVSNRTVTLKPLALWPHPNSVPSYDRINTNSGSGAFSISNMMDGTYQVDVLSPPDNTRFFIVISNAGPAVSADTIMYASPTSTYPPGNYSWSITASDARYARWTATNSAASAVGSNTVIVLNNGTNYYSATTDTNVVSAIVPTIPVKSTGSTTPRLIADRFSDPANIEDYGAVDGSDSTVAIQSALNASLNVYIPPGNFKVSSNLFGRSGQKVSGVGTLQVIQTNITCLTFANASNVVVQGIQIIANGDAQSGAFSTNHNCINLLYCTNSIVQSCKLSNFGLAGVMVYDCTKCTVLNNVIIGIYPPVNGFGGNINMQAGGVGNLIQDNYIENGSTGIQVQTDKTLGGSGVMSNNVIKGNYISTMSAYGIIDYLADSGSNNTANTFIGNTIDNITGSKVYTGDGTKPYGMGIYIQAAVKDMVINNVVSRCLLQNDSEVLAPGAIAVANSTECTLEGNQVESCAKDGIYIINANSMGDPKGIITVTGGSVSHCRNAISIIDHGNVSVLGVAMSGITNANVFINGTDTTPCPNIIVQGCRVDAPASGSAFGVHALAAQDLKIFDNAFTLVAYGTYLEATVTNAVVRGNTFKSSVYGLVSVETNFPPRITGNQFVGDVTGLSHTKAILDVDNKWQDCSTNIAGPAYFTIAPFVFTDGGGNVGFNITNPAARLDVSGGTIQANQFVNTQANVGTLAYWDANKNISWNPNPAQIFGKAYIGAVSGNNSGTVGLMLTSDNPPAGQASQGIMFGGNGLRHGVLAYMPNENQFVLRTGNTATNTTDDYGPPNLTLTGRLGIGTNAPQNALHVVGRTTLDGQVTVKDLTTNALVGTANDFTLQSVTLGPGLVLSAASTVLSATVSNALATAFTTNSDSVVTGIVAGIVSSFPYATNSFTTNPPATTTNIVIGLAHNVLAGLPYLTNAFTTNTSAGATGVVNSIIAIYPFTFTSSNYVDTVSNALFGLINTGDNGVALAAAIGTLNATNGLNIALSNWIRLLATNTYAGIINALGFTPATNGIGSGWFVGGNTISSGSSTFGTLDDFPINFTANNQAIGKIEATAAGANIILGTANALASNKSVSSNNLVIGGYGGSLIGASYNTIVGGRNHILSATNYNTIIGGYGGLIAVDSNSIVAGGYANHISTLAGGGNSIFGGSANTISNAGFFSSIIGGRFNAIGDNSGVAYSSAILGGENNKLGAEGSYSTILGGDANYIQSSYNILGGHGVSSSNLNCFVWGDDQGSFYSTNANSFNVQARGGVRLSTGSEAVKMNNATVYANLNAPANIANFGFTANPITLGAAYTNTTRRATLILNIAANYVTNGVPSCTVSIEQLGRGGATTNLFTHSPLPLYFPMASCAITNIVNVGHVNPSGVVTVTDTSTGGASVSIVKSVIELE